MTLLVYPLPQHVCPRALPDQALCLFAKGKQYALLDFAPLVSWKHVYA